MEIIKLVKNGDGAEVEMPLLLINDETLLPPPAYCPPSDLTLQH